jgi:D-erythro-7,8-dihydroneopterin triphosphate epimerase
MATINIVDLRIRALIGTNSWERTNKQELILNITLEYDAVKASRSDNLKDAMDYQKIANAVTKTVENSRCLLLEKLASKVMDTIKRTKGLQKASLRIDKPQALADARCVSYQISL